MAGVFTLISLVAAAWVAFWMPHHTFFNHLLVQVHIRGLRNYGVYAAGVTDLWAGGVDHNGITIPGRQVAIQQRLTCGFQGI